LVTVSEKNSLGFLYDIDGIENPILEQVFHLSEASKDKNAGTAYADRTLGEVDTETILFLSEDESPTGKPSVLFAGAWSSTISYWEFDCPAAAAENDPTNPGSSANTRSGLGLVSLVMALGRLFFAI
jgi:hypothetical protein